jgi:hypothetical protein|nr:MAG TPA: peptidase [Caudoviricetes sp.]
MATTFTAPPSWSNVGVAPSETLKTNGFQAGYKPPAPVFNYMFNKYGICIDELQKGKADTYHTHGMNNITGLEAALNGKASVSHLHAEYEKKTGKSLHGQTVYPESGVSKVAGTGAEIFNDYQERTFGQDPQNSDVQIVNQGNVASSEFSHAEGTKTTAAGYASHAEGEATEAKGYASHAEGFHTTASGNYSHAEGAYTTASENNSHAEGNSTKASGTYAHAEGTLSKASGAAAHAEGLTTTASGMAAHAEGQNATASGESSHAEGNSTKASESNSHAEGESTTASGVNSHAEGIFTKAIGANSHASGASTTANDYQFVTGKYNTDKTGCTDTSDQSTDNSIFIIGYGTATTKANAFRVTAAGNCMGAQSFGSSGADYAEFFEWLDGNESTEDRRGLFVTLDGDKIRLATAADDYIVGVISVNPSVVGDVQSENWHGMYKKDVFGQPLTETVEVPESTDEETGRVVPAHTFTRYVVNPDYDPDEEYTSREFRKEWACVGLMGKLIVVDDGTCEVNGYCKAADGGKATKADTGYRVTKRIDGTHIQILYR